MPGRPRRRRGDWGRPYKNIVGEWRRYSRNIGFALFLMFVLSRMRVILINEVDTLQRRYKNAQLVMAARTEEIVYRGQLVTMPSPERKRMSFCTLPPMWEMPSYHQGGPYNIML